MRCTLIGVGSRGDVQPLLALGAGLRAAGLRVRLATHRDFESMVLGAGLEFAPVEGHSAHFSAGPAGRAFRDRVGDATRFRQFVDNYLGLFLQRMFRDTWAAAEDADIVLSWVPGATSIAERLRVPVFVVGLTPALHLPTSAFPNPFHAPSTPGSPAANRRTWRLALPTLQIGQRQLDDWRTRTLGLEPLPWRRQVRELRRLPHLLGYSTSVLPRPVDWAPWIHVPGYWFFDHSGPFTPAPELARFLDGGDPPIVIGFSSQVSGNAAELTRVVVESVTQAGARAILVSGYGGLTGVELPETILPVSHVPYDWLFPRIRGVVHQGGAGSTAAAMRAGVPNLAVTFGFDQGLWGHRIHALGVGPAPLPAATLTTEALTRALRELISNDAMRARARSLAERLGAEDGIGAAVAIVLAALEGRRRRSAEV